MSVKNSVLKLLEENKGKYYSGEEIAKILSVTRTSVWKAVKSLQKEGYSILAVTNKGYMMTKDNDIISESGIEKYITITNPLKINVEQVVSSTNMIVKEMAQNGEPEGVVLVATEQTNGRGRFKRNFYSPKESGIYMSILLRPTFLSIEKSINITTIAGICVCEALAKNCNVSPKIKWVNDIFVNERKVSGILSEASLDIETGLLDFVVLGIGINLYFPENDFPQEISNIAGSVLNEKQPDMKNKVIADILNTFFEYYYNMDKYDLAKKYKDLSFVISKKINVIKGDNEISAVVVDIDDDYHLIVQYEDGTIEALSSGEISIKL